MRILYITTIGMTMNFFKDIVKQLIEDGNKVDIACNGKESPVDDYFYQLGCKVYQVDMSRHPIDFHNYSAIRKLKKIIKENEYEIVHCHTPVASVCTRLACKNLRKNGVKVVYTAHGFHFYKGAHIKNWIIYFPIEKICSRYTDAIVLINQEDYNLAKKKFHIKDIEYIHGVGLDINKYKNATVDFIAKRKEINVPQNAFVIITTAELNKNKNQRVIIDAISRIDDNSIHYILAGKGDEEESLADFAIEKGVSDRVHFLGYRNDIDELLKVSNLNAFPSIREGLGMAALQGMAAGIPLMCSDNRGTREYAINHENAFVCGSAEEYKNAILTVMSDCELVKKMVKNGEKCVEKFSRFAVNQQNINLYNRVLSKKDC